MQEAKEIALDHVRRERLKAKDAKVDTTELKDGSWHVSGAWMEVGEAALGSTHFEIVINARTGEITKSEFRPGFAAAFL